MRTLILCGGKGTRAYPQTVELPKPLLEVAGRPVLGHLMEIYAAQGFTEFVLAAGYKSELVWKFAQSLPKDWRIEGVDTREDPNTGRRGGGGEGPPGGAVLLAAGRRPLNGESPPDGQIPRGARRARTG